MSIKQKIIDLLDDGVPLCSGSANNLTTSQSGWRELRIIVKQNPDDYRYFYAKSSIKGRRQFKVFFKNFVSPIVVRSAFNSKYEIHALGSVHYKSIEYDSYSEAHNHIRKIGE